MTVPRRLRLVGFGQSLGLVRLRNRDNERVMRMSVGIDEVDDIEGPCRFCDDAGPHEGWCCAGCFDVLADEDAWREPLEVQRRLVAAADVEVSRGS